MSERTRRRKWKSKRMVIIPPTIEEVDEEEMVISLPPPQPPTPRPRNPLVRVDLSEEMLRRIAVTPTSGDRPSRRKLRCMVEDLAVKTDGLQRAIERADAEEEAAAGSSGSSSSSVPFGSRLSSFLLEMINKSGSSSSSNPAIIPSLPYIPLDLERFRRVRPSRSLARRESIPSPTTTTTTENVGGPRALLSLPAAMPSVEIEDIGEDFAQDGGSELNNFEGANLEELELEEDWEEDELQPGPSNAVQRYDSKVQREKKNVFFKKMDNLKNQPLEVILYAIQQELIQVAKSQNVNPLRMIGMNTVGSCRMQDYGCEHNTMDEEEYEHHSKLECPFVIFTRCWVESCVFHDAGSFDNFVEVYDHVSRCHPSLVRTIHGRAPKWSTFLSLSHAQLTTDISLCPHFAGKMEIEQYGLQATALVFLHIMKEEDDHFMYLYALVTDKKEGSHFFLDVRFLLRSPYNYPMSPTKMNSTAILPFARTFSEEFYLYMKREHYPYKFRVSSLANVTDYTLTEPERFLLDVEYRFLRYNMEEKFLLNRKLTWAEMGIHDPDFLRYLVGNNMLVPTTIQSIISPAVSDTSSEKALVVEMRDMHETRLAVFGPIVHRLMVRRSLGEVDDRGFMPNVVVIVPTRMHVIDMYRWFERVFHSCPLAISTAVQLDTTTGLSVCKESATDIYIGTAGGVYRHWDRPQDKILPDRVDTFVVWRADRVFNPDGQWHITEDAKFLGQTDGNVKVVVQYNDRMAYHHPVEEIMLPPSRPFDFISIGPVLTHGLEVLKITREYTKNSTTQKDDALKKLLKEDPASYKTHYVFLKAYNYIGSVADICRKNAFSGTEVLSFTNKNNEVEQYLHVKIAQKMRENERWILCSTPFWIGGFKFPNPDRVIIYGVPILDVDFLAILHSCVSNDGNHAEVAIIEREEEKAGLCHDRLEDYLRMIKGEYADGGMWANNED